MVLPKKVTYGLAFLVVVGISATATVVHKNMESAANLSKQALADTGETNQQKYALVSTEDLATEIRSQRQLYGPKVSSLASRGELREKDDTSVNGMVSAKDVNIRVYPSTDSDVIKCLSTGEAVMVMSRWDSWYKIGLSEKSSGWIHKDFLKVSSTASSESTEELLKKIPVEKPKEVTPAGQKMVNYSKKYMGVRYVWGGTSPKGFDCSGFVQYVCRQYGVYLERVAADQARQGTKVSKANLKPGDLVFFATEGAGYISHVGIYIGNGDFIHASSGAEHRVTVSDLSSGYYANTFVTARRIF